MYYNYFKIKFIKEIIVYFFYIIFYNQWHIILKVFSIMNIQSNKFKSSNLLLLYILLGLVLHLVSAFFSIGFYSDDEHFQILEPVAHLMGFNNVIIDDPTGHYWEWESWARIRPWLQPYIYYYFISLLKFFGISDPFNWSLAIRLFSSILGYLSIIYLFFTIKEDFFKKNSNFNYLLFFTFWFYPFLHSRTSSENLSIIFYVFAFCVLYKQVKFKNHKLNYFILFNFSLLMGLGLVVKFNLIFAVLPFFLWILLFRFHFNRIFFMGLGIIFALLIGLYIDYIFWGSYKNTYYQYYKHNIITGTLDSFGVQPWWYYLSTTIIELAPVLSLFFVIALIVFWLKQPKSIFTWITFITIFSFSLFGHKEIRYIFPVYLFAPLFISYFFETFSKIKFEKFYKALIIISNIIFLILTLFTPANNKVGVYEFLYNNYNKGENVFYLQNNPYLVNNMEPFFYTKFLPEIKVLENEYMVKQSLLSNSWIITNIVEEYKEVTYKNNKCKKKYSTYPEIIMNLNKNWRKLKLNWYIIYCT